MTTKKKTTKIKLVCAHHEWPTIGCAVCRDNFDLDNRPTKKTTKRVAKKVLTPGFKKIELNQKPQWDLSNKDHIDWGKKSDEIGVDNDAVKIVTDKNKKIMDDWIKPMYESRGYKDWDEIGVDNDPGIDVPLHARGGRWKWNFESENMSSELAIMWVLAGLCILFALFAMHGDQQALNAGLIH